MPTKTLVTSYEQDQRLFRDMWHKVGIVLFVIAALIFPFVASAKWMTVGNLALVAVVGSIGLMILTGFAGQISLGHAAFLAVGAYTCAVFGNHLALPFWLCIPAAGVLAALVGLAIGPFALRLRGLYLAIVTIGLLFLVAHVLHSFPELTGGVSGISVPMLWGFSAESASFHDTWTVGPIELTSARKLYFLFLLIAIATTYASKNIQRSDLGRSMIAVRDHDLAAAVLGVNPARVKIIAFGLSSFFAGIAGAMFAYQQQYITIEPPFDLAMSVNYIAMVVLGGVGTTFGAVAGALAFTVLSPVAQLVAEYIPYISELSSAQQSTLLFAILVCLFLIFEPLGILGIWLRIKRYFIAWPFRY